MNRILPFILTSAVVLGTAADAWACGGFFCGGQPMDQSSERIVFSVDDEDVVTTHVQIFYEGAAEQFAWVVPAPAQPELFLSTDALFQYLDNNTQPYFWTNWREEGTCTWGDSCWMGDFMCPMAEAAFDDGDASAGGGGVEVIEERQVGPYDTAILRANSADDLLEWLQTNDYDIPDDLNPILAAYIAEQSHFVALKLQSDKDTGDIAPIAMRYGGGKPLIPIQLTAIAATPDMRLEVYLFGDGRGVPTNYLHVQINEAAIDWLSGGTNYNDVITQAADEAGGHAFATDFSGDAGPLAGGLYRDSFDTDALKAISDPAQFVSELLSQGFPRNSTMQNLLRQHIPMPAALVEDGVDERSFYNCLSCYEEHLTGIEFDPVAFVAELTEIIIEPLQDAEELFEYPKLTRLTSSISPEEMTLDPVFGFNSELGDVSREHTADLVFECGDGGTYANSPRRLELKDGTVIRLPSSEWIVDAGTTDAEFVSDELGQPAAAVIEETKADAAPIVVVDNSEQIDSMVDDHNQMVDEINNDGSGCGCADTQRGPWEVMFMALALLGWRRRLRLG